MADTAFRKELFHYKLVLGWTQSFPCTPLYPHLALMSTPPLHSSNCQVVLQYVQIAALLPSLPQVMEAVLLCLFWQAPSVCRGDTWTGLGVLFFFEWVSLLKTVLMGFPQLQVTLFGHLLTKGSSRVSLYYRISVI